MRMFAVRRKGAIPIDKPFRAEDCIALMDIIAGESYQERRKQNGTVDIAAFFEPERIKGVLDILVDEAEQMGFGDLRVLWPLKSCTEELNQMKTG